ncbi:MAG: tryptophan synthase subunit alpha [Deltaproteobacteria bacterium]|nr:tryptophan synthase subunit alpha [Deltaproteobacteria bacterium]MDL1960901.1 tryptophan synthase subunit alpha [Deltaproteobacteria bacterium]
MNRIDRMFSQLRKRKEAALIPFITTGDPDIATTEELILEMDRQGADLIELGLPFSDPLADGPTIQASSQRALRHKINAKDLFGLVEKVREKTSIPLVLMGYYNPILQYGLSVFAKDAVNSGLDGTIVPDLPLEEAGAWMAVAKPQGLANILLVAPNTPANRVKKIAKATQGFLYYVSVTGITGARSQLPTELSQGLDGIKQLTNKPVAVGFGISTPAQVSMLSAVTDGIIVGSAIIKLIEAHTIKQGNDLKSGPGLVKKVGEFIGELKKATRI